MPGGGDRRPNKLERQEGGFQTRQSLIGYPVRVPGPEPRRRTKETA